MKKPPAIAPDFSNTQIKITLACGKLTHHAQ